MALASGGTPDGTYEYDHSYSNPGATSQLKMSVVRLELPVCFQERIPESATLDWLWQKHRENQTAVDVDQNREEFEWSCPQLGQVFPGGFFKESEMPTGSS
jgi:hypothetical protein